MATYRPIGNYQPIGVSDDSTRRLAATLNRKWQLPFGVAQQRVLQLSVLPGDWQLSEIPQYKGGSPQQWRPVQWVGSSETWSLGHVTPRGKCQVFVYVLIRVACVPARPYVSGAAAQAPQCTAALSRLMLWQGHPPARQQGFCIWTFSPTLPAACPQGIKLGVSSRGWASLCTDPRSACRAACLCINL